MMSSSCTGTLPPSTPHSLHTTLTVPCNCRYFHKKAAAEVQAKAKHKKKQKSEVKEGEKEGEVYVEGSNTEMDFAG